MPPGHDPSFEQQTLKISRHILFFFQCLFYWSIVDLQCFLNFCCTAMTHLYIYICTFSFDILSHCGLSQDTEYSSLCSTVGLCCLSILRINAYIFKNLQTCWRRPTRVKIICAEPLVLSLASRSNPLGSLKNRSAWAPPLEIWIHLFRGAVWTLGFLKAPLCFSQAARLRTASWELPH